MRVFETAGFFQTILENKALSLLVTILATVLLFGALIFIHEFGHYLTARLFGVKIREFSIGMGPKLFGKTSDKTGILYALRALPIGGYVAMEGEDEDSSDPDAFSNKKVWQRMIVTAAGSCMNLLLGLLLTVIFVLTMPRFFGTTVTAFPERALSDKCENALQVGDEILKVASHRVYTGQELVYEIFRAGAGENDRVVEDGTVVAAKVDLTVRREGETLLLRGVTFPVDSEKGLTFALRDFYYNEEAKTFGSFTKNVTRQMILTVRMVYESLFDLLTGRYGIEQVSGPVGTAEVVGDAIKQDAAAKEGESRNSLLYLAMTITINLGLFNLLPVPALDGGRLLFLAIEGIFRKPVPKKFEGIINFVGIVLLMGLMLMVTMKDVIGLFR